MMIMNALSSRTLEKGRTEGDEECVQELYEAAQGHAHQPRRSGKLFRGVGYYSRDLGVKVLS